MNEAKVLRWGVLGCARIATVQVIPAIQAARCCEVTALASRRPEPAREAARRLRIPKVHDSYEALIADPEVDAIYNPLPNHLHAPWTIRALEAGKHVLCEKPIALDAEEAAKIAEAAVRAGRVVGEALMVRFHPQWARVRQLIGEGRLGRVRAVQAFFSYEPPAEGDYRNAPEAGGGALYDIGCYAIFAGRQAFGADPERAIGLFERDGAGGVDVLTSAMLAFPGGGQLSFFVSSGLRRGQRVVIHGDGGRLDMEAPFNPALDRPARLVFDDSRDLFGGGVTVEEVDGGPGQFTYEAEAFAAAALDGAPFAWTMADAIVNQRTVDALFRSGGSGRWETI